MPAGKNLNRNSHQDYRRRHGGRGPIQLSTISGDRGSASLANLQQSLTGRCLTLYCTVSAQQPVFQGTGASGWALAKTEQKQKTGLWAVPPISTDQEEPLAGPQRKPSSRRLLPTPPYLFPAGFGTSVLPHGI